MAERNRNNDRGRKQGRSDARRLFLEVISNPFLFYLVGFDHRNGTALFTEAPHSSLAIESR